MGSAWATLTGKLEAEMRRSRFAAPRLVKGAFPVKKQARDLFWIWGRLYPEKSFDCPLRSRRISLGD